MCGERIIFVETKWEKPDSNALPRTLHDISVSILSTRLDIIPFGPCLRHLFSGIMIHKFFQYMAPLKAQLWVNNLSIRVTFRLLPYLWFVGLFIYQENKLLFLLTLITIFDFPTKLLSISTNFNLTIALILNSRLKLKFSSQVLLLDLCELLYENKLITCFWLTKLIRD